jgi:mRNA interferase MazF
LSKPGDVVVVDFPGVQGTKRRPAIIVSSDEYHRTRPDVIIGIITSQLPGSPGPTDHILGDWRIAGLNKPSAFRAFLVTLPRIAILAPIGRPTPADWTAIIRCAHVAIAS